MRQSTARTSGAGCGTCDPAAGDARAEAITRRARTAVSQSLLDSLDESDAVALGRYGARQPAIALRQKSIQRLEDALLASALAQLVRPTDPGGVLLTSCGNRRETVCPSCSQVYKRDTRQLVRGTVRW